MLDLDDFKKVNDVYGHGIGDHLLQQVADVLRGSVRGSDVVCRVGGEEFAVILPAGDIRSSTALAERFGDELGELEAEAVGKLSSPRASPSGLKRREPARARRMRRGRDDDGQDAREGPRRAVRRERPRAPDGGAHPPRRRAVDRAPEDAAEPLRQAFRLNDVAQIGLTIADELRLLIDYHNCRVFLRNEDDLVPVAFRGDLIVDAPGDPVDLLPHRSGAALPGASPRRDRS